MKILRTQDIGTHLRMETFNTRNISTFDKSIIFE